MKRRESFTLIEMLIVITVIGILAGISFKLVQIAKRNADRANTVGKLEKIAHALNEFKAEYGIYPPVKPGVCEAHTRTNHPPIDCRMCYLHENTDTHTDWLNNNYFVDPVSRDRENLFDMGLVSFLLERDRTCIGHYEVAEWIPDTDRDKLAKQSWAVSMDGLAGSSSITNKVGNIPYANTLETIKDSWDNVIRYICDPPYESYDLWSVGPDGVDGTSDDIHKDRWDD